MSAVGSRYAKALLELAKESGQVDVVFKQLNELGDAWNESAELRQLVQNPSVTKDTVKKTFDALLSKFGASPMLKNTLNVLADRGRLTNLPEVIASFSALAEAEKGTMRAEVTTAKAMSDAYYAELKTKLEQLTGTQVVLIKKEDPSIIAGVITRVGDQVFDGSVRNRLDELKEELLAADSNQIAI